MGEWVVVIVDCCVVLVEFVGRGVMIVVCCR